MNPITHWFALQLSATLQEIHKEITIPHIVTAVMLYAIVHTIVRSLKSTKDVTVRLQRREATKLHVYERHDDKLTSCRTGSCEVFGITNADMLSAE